MEAMLISATDLVREYTVVTGNVRHFNLFQFSRWKLVVEQH